MLITLRLLMLIEKELVRFKEKFDKELENFLSEKIREAEKVSPWALQFINNFEECVKGSSGKRIRPALMYFGYLASGGKNKAAIIRAAMSVELLHIAFLIQDDIIDRDALRHGKPTMHWAYKKYAEENLNLNKSESYHYGISQAICIADVGIEMAYKALADSSFANALKIKAISKLSKTVFNTAMGEMSDVLAENLPNVNEKQVLNILEYKTARYTIYGPFSIGLTLAGKSEKDISRLRDYAVPLGVAFQIRDDILGMFGDSAVTGKPVGADLKEGKKTLLIINALRKAMPKQKQIILKNLGNKGCSEKGLNEVREIIKETGSLDYSNRLAEKLAAESKKALHKLPLSGKNKMILSDIADYIVKRNK